MGNPFGKIIQNGVEYDVSQYPNKIEIAPTASETYTHFLARLYNQLKTKVSDLTSIKRAEIHFIDTKTTYHDVFYFTNKQRGPYGDKMSFIGGSATGTQVTLATLILYNACKYVEITVGGSASDLSSSTLLSTMKAELYYS